MIESITNIFKAGLGLPGWRSNKVQKVVVTGGAGFIGSHLAEKLAERDNHVIVLDDFSTGKSENISRLDKKQDVAVIRGSVTDLPLLRSAFKGADYVFHLAAIASVPRSIKEPELSHTVNLTGTLNVLIAARDSGVKKVVFSSSSAVYGDTPTLPQFEDMLPGPQTPYAVAKLAAEYYCRAFQQVYSLSTVCLRYFNVYGPRQDPASQYAAAIPKFIKMISSAQPPVIFGDGKQTRDFIYVKDVVQANLLAAESDSTGVFNIGSGKATTVNELVGIITQRMGSNLKPVYEAERSGDIKHSLSDISKAAAIGFKPEYSLEKGLWETILAFR